jgi:hypothetical protein
MGAVPPVTRGNAPTNTSQNTGEWLQGVREAVTWHMVVLENVNTANLRQGTRITGQFIPQQFTHNLGAQLPEAGGYSRTHPVVQWVGGTVETLTFQARLFSEHRDSQSARDKFETLKLLVNHVDDTLKRPPLVRFFWGNAIPGGMKCFVETLGGVQYDEIRPDGSMRGVSMNITLKRFVPFRVVRVTTSPAERTPTHTVRIAETYEMIAQRRWGDPMLGVPLRQQNPRFPMEKWAPKGIADLEANEVIKLFPRVDLEREPIKPQSHIFDENNFDAADNRRFFFSIRGAKTGVIPRK